MQNTGTHSTDDSQNVNLKEFLSNNFMTGFCECVSVSNVLDIVEVLLLVLPYHDVWLLPASLCITYVGGVRYEYSERGGVTGHTVWQHGLL